MNLTLPWTASRQTPVDGVTSKLDEIRKALGHEADRLAEAAAQFGRDATGTVAKIAAESGSSAAKLGHDAVSQATKAGADATDKAASVAKDPVGATASLGQQLARGIADVGAAIATSGRQTAKDLTHDAGTVARDLRKVRITTEPKQTAKPDALPGITLLAGFGTGIALMYFFDPERGRRRRSLLRDQLMKWTRMGRETLQGRAKDMQNRASGAGIEARKAASSLTGGQTADQGEDMYAPTGYGDDPIVSGSSPEPTENGDSGFGAAYESGDLDRASTLTTESWEEQVTEEPRASRIEIN